MERISDVIDSGLSMAVGFSEVLSGSPVGLSVEAASIMRSAMSGVAIELNINMTRQVSLEHFASKYSNAFATKVALEGVVEFFEGIWKAIKEFIKKIWDSIKSLFGAGVNKVKKEKTKKEIEDTKLKIEKIENAIDDKEMKDLGGTPVEKGSALHKAYGAVCYNEGAFKPPTIQTMNSLYAITEDKVTKTVGYLTASELDMRELAKTIDEISKSRSPEGIRNKSNEFITRHKEISNNLLDDNVKAKEFLDRIKDNDFTMFDIVAIKSIWSDFKQNETKLQGHKDTLNKAMESFEKISQQVESDIDEHIKHIDDAGDDEMVKDVMREFMLEYKGVNTATFTWIKYVQKTTDTYIDNVLNFINENLKAYKLK